MVEPESGIPIAYWKVVRSYEQFMHFIRNQGMPRVISFDNDLHPTHYGHYAEACNTGKFYWENVQPKMGIHALQYILNTCKELELKLPIFYIHTANHLAREEMYKLINNY